MPGSFERFNQATMRMNVPHFLKSPAYALTLLFVCLCLSAFATFGSGHFLQKTLGTPFDSLALGFLQGKASIPDGAVVYESIRVGDKNVIYFGPFPALLRIPFLLLFPSTFGLLAPLLCSLGGLFATSALLFVFREATNRPRKIFGRFSPFLLTLIFALGSPILYLVAVPTVYQEAILWALGFSLWAIAIYYRATIRGWNTGALVLLSICTGGAILSRLTFGLPLLGLMLAGIFLTFWNDRKNLVSSKALKSLLLIAVPLMLAGSFQLWYNTARFGSPLTFLTWKGYEMESQQAREKRAAQGSFNARRIPSSFYEYLGVHKDYLSPSFPYISPWSPARAGRSDLYFSDAGEATVSITIASPILILFSLIGIISLVRTKFSPLTYACIVFFGQTVLICSWYYIAFRYTAEFLPFFVVLALAALEGPIQKTNRFIRGGILCIGLISIVTMGVSTARIVIYQTGIPESYREMLKGTIGSGR